MVCLSARLTVCVRCRYEKKVKDYNFGSLIRTDARQEYSETNTIFGQYAPPPPPPPVQAHHAARAPVTRIQVRPVLCRLRRPATVSDTVQFYAFEIARNRLGLNDKAHEIAKAEAAKEKEKAEKEKARAEREKAKKKKN